MKQNITISSEDAEFIEFAYSLINSAKFPSFTKTTEVYNRVLNKQLSSTSCAQWIRQRILELKATLDKLNEEILKEKEEKEIILLKENKEIKNGGEIKKESKEVEEKSAEDQGVEEAEQLKEKKLKRKKKNKNNQGSASW